MKICSVSYIIKNFQIKIKLIYPYTSISMAKPPKYDNSKP